MTVFRRFKSAIKRIIPFKEASFLREKDKYLNLYKRKIYKHGKVISISATTQAQNAEIISLRKALDSQKKEIQSLRNDLRKLNKDIRTSAWGNYMLSDRDAINAYISTLPQAKYPEELCKWFFHRTGSILNLENPVTFNEKIQWLKLYDSTPLKTRLSDKYLVRDWVREKVGEQYLIPLLGVWEHFDDIDFTTLPNQFVLKTNHGSKTNIIVTDKTTFDQNDARKTFNKWLRINLQCTDLRCNIKISNH